MIQLLNIPTKSIDQSWGIVKSDIADALHKSNTTKAVELSDERNRELRKKGAKDILDVVKVITDDYNNPHPVDKLQDK